MMHYFQNKLCIISRYCLVVVIIFSSLHSHAQQLSQVTFSQATSFSWFSLLTSQNILIRISDDGRILEYGTEQSSLYNRNYYAPNLLPYGTIIYYQHEPDSTLNGKIKNIGTCFFTYYGFNDYPERVGKIKTAGVLMFDYYRKFDDALTAGKIKTMGSSTITYYGSYDNESLKGKPKSIGNTAIQYYSSFENPQLKGKLKSIGGFRLDWATTFAGSNFATYLKTGNQRELIDGIQYILQ